MLRAGADGEQFGRSDGSDEPKCSKRKQRGTS